MLKTKTLRIVFWHQEVASGPFCLLVNCPWLLVFAQYLFFLFLSAFNLYFWSNKHFSWSLDLVFLFNFFFAVVGLHLYFTDLIRESYKQYEILLIVLFLGFLIFVASEALLFISFFWASFHTLTSPSIGIFGIEQFFVPDPCQLAWSNTVLLSFYLY